MKNSFRIGSIFGITVRVHWMFLPLLWLVLLSAKDPLSGSLLLAALFGSVFLHELGHSLMAMHFGIRVLDITFWPLGGMARMSEIPEDSRVEGLIAVAGPAVNFVLLVLFVGLHALTSGSVELDLVSPLWTAGAPPLLYFASVNFLLGTFNLVPAFPMDGGRILRAALATRYDWVEATERAVRVGRIVAVGMVFASFWVPGMVCTVPFIAIFIWFVGGRELAVVRMRHAQRTGGGAQDPLSFLLRAFAQAASAGGGAPGGPGGPRGSGVGDPFGPFRDAVRRGPRTPFGPDAPGGFDAGPAGPAREAEFEVHGEPAPDAVPPGPPAASGRGAGFSDEDVERLERFRGRLGQRPEPPE